MIAEWSELTDNLIRHDLEAGMQVSAHPLRWNSPDEAERWLATRGREFDLLQVRAEAMYYADLWRKGERVSISIPKWSDFTPIAGWIPQTYDEWDHVYWARDDPADLEHEEKRWAWAAEPPEFEVTWNRATGEVGILPLKR